ncbi:dephospho-CoA kinase [Humidisolicoccus flavus]|uniref:dephospho-CoA kinase n=1 Tax=Humidisolicoccus flavus TaxID=3111414 RepID=UPI00324F3F10
MTFLGLTGGIAAGKSTIARTLQSLGAIVFDADAVAREVVEPGEPAFALIVDRFGQEVLRADGSLDRQALGRVIFDDATARRDLEQITHPAIRARVQERVRAIRAEHPGSVIVYDIPLLVETGAQSTFDSVVVAHAPVETRIERLITRRGMTREEAEARIASQASDGERLAVADYVIDTGGSLDQTHAQTEALWAELLTLSANADHDVSGSS